MKQILLLRNRMLISVLIMLFCLPALADEFPAVNTSALSEYDKNAPIGFGASATGSEDENPVTVTTLDELTAALAGTDKKTVYVSGTITFTGRVKIDDAANKTIYGLPGATLANTTHSDVKDQSGILTLSGCSNIIMRNLTFKGAGAYDIDGYDNLTLSGCTNIWIDHCDFQDGVDGNFDCNNASDNICVSWCRFRYLITPWSGGSGGSNDHRFSNLWGGGDTATDDEGHLNTTFYACWWDNGCKQRMPRIRYGKVHILNCLYSSSSADYCIGAGYRSNIYVEKSKFAISNNAWQNFATSGSYTDYNIQLVGNEGASDDIASSGSIAQFVPSYNYTPMAASAVQAAVSNATNGAGATLTYGQAAQEITVSTAVLSWYLGENGAEATAANSITGASGSTAEGFTIAITGNTGKSWSNGNGDITYNNTTYKTLKNSNGAQNTVTLPTGMYAHKVEFYATTNADDGNGVLSEFNETSCSDAVTSVKDYSKPTYISKEFTTGVKSFTFTFSTKQVCFIAVVTYSNSETLEPEPTETAFKDFAAIVNNQTGTLLTPEEQVQGTTVNFGVAVDNSGNTIRVAADDASSIATISGTYHNDHGMTGLKVVTSVPGKVTIQIGSCTYSTNKITVTNSDNEKVIEYTPTEDDLKCWKNDHSNIIELSYNGPATTLTITGMNYCPFIGIKKVKSTVEKALYSTDFSEWSAFSASSTATSINKTTNYTDETLTFSVLNTALMSVTDESKFGSYTTLPHNALQAAKAADPYVTTSALGNITKVRYIHGATGGSRGWKLEAKGDGDTDWVTISDSYADPAAWCEVTKEINRTNCQLRFTNLNASQNAYMFELEIFGEVEIKLYEITGTITGGDINGSTITLTGNGETYTADVVDGSFTASVPAGTYTINLSNDVPYLLVSPTQVEVTAAGSIGTITIEAASAQTVSGTIANAPAEAFTLTFTSTSNQTTQVPCEAGATSYTTSLMPSTYTISSNVGTLSPLSVENFKVVKEAVTHNIYYPEAASPAATQQEITVNNTLNVASANNYKTVTDALAAAKAGSISAPVITLTSGQTYREQVIVDIADVTFKTSGTEKATITFYYGIGYCYYSLNSKGVYDKDRAMTRNSIIKRDPERWGATVKVTRNGKNFKAENIIFENSFNQYYTQEEIIDGVQPNGVQSITYDRTLTANESGYKAADSKAVTERAAAIAFEGDPKGCQLYNCEFRGSQDTFYTGSSNTLYVKDCNIIGNTDYIFGGGYVVFDNCDLTIGGYSDQDVSAYITAYKDGDNLEAGKCYVFRDCTVKGSNRTHVKANLGRDWGGAAASVYYFNLKNEIGDKMSFTWTNMGGGINAGTANLHIYDFDPTVNANYNTTGSNGANINGVLTEAEALPLYADVVSTLGFTPERIYKDALELSEASYYNACRIAAAAYASNNVTRTVKLTRAIGADKWNTIVLPFDMTADQVTSTFGEGTKLAQLTSGSTADNLKFTTATEITANQPYAIKVPTAITVAEPVNISGVTIKGDEPTQEAGGWNFVGTYTKGNIPNGSYFFSSNKLYLAADDTNTIKAFRAWFTYNGANASRNLSVTIDDETTSISEEIRVKGEESDGVIYDLQGRRVRSAEANSSLFTIHSSLKPGVYIVNGKCVIIK